MKVFKYKKAIKEIKEFGLNACLDDDAFVACERCIEIINNNIEEQGSKLRIPKYLIFDKIDTFLRENPDWIPDWVLWDNEDL